MGGERLSGPCPFLGNIEHVPAGPDGDDLEACPVAIKPGTIRVKPGDEIVVSNIPTVLRRIRRCRNGEVWCMVEYPDGGLLWTELSPAPVPDLTEWQKAQLEWAEKKIPLQYLVQGDWRDKVGDRVSRGNGRMGTIVLMAATRPFFSAGTIVAMDDGSMSIGDDAMALMDGRIAHASSKR